MGFVQVLYKLHSVCMTAIAQTRVEVTGVYAHLDLIFLFMTALYTGTTFIGISEGGGGILNRVVWYFEEGGVVL